MPKHSRDNAIPAHAMPAVDIWAPPENAWGALARDLVMWSDMGTKTPRTLFRHLKNVGREIPDWLRNEPEMRNLDHTPSKGTRAVLIYRAMLDGLLQSGASVPVSIPAALREQTCTIGRSGKTITIECDDATDADQVMDLLTEIAGNSVGMVEPASVTDAIEAVVKIEKDREGAPHSRTQDEFHQDAADTVQAVLKALQFKDRPHHA